jgi:hypothetical protein
MAGEQFWVQAMAVQAAAAAGTPPALRNRFLPVNTQIIAGLNSTKTTGSNATQLMSL